MNRRAKQNRLRWRAVAATLPAVVLWLGGCERPSAEGDYAVLAGTVEGLRSDTFELAVRVAERWPGRPKGEAVACLLTNDAEVYVNGRFSAFSAIAIGDAVELAGYYEPNRRGERFVVSLANITRNEPLPPEPDLTPPATQPANP